MQETVSQQKNTKTCPMCGKANNTSDTFCGRRSCNQKIARMMRRAKQASEKNAWAAYPVSLGNDAYCVRFNMVAEHGIDDPDNLTRGEYQKIKNKARESMQ